MYKNNRNTSLLICLTLVSISVFDMSAALASEFSSNKTKVVFYAGIDSGGDKLVTTFFSDGSTGGIEAGEGLYFAVGGLVPVNDDGSFQAQFTLGIKTESSEADNGGLEFSRWPLEAIGFYNFKYARIGAGLTYHINPSLEGEGVASNVQVDFDDALGAIVEVGFLFNSFGIAYRHTEIEYTLSGASNKIDGSSDGIHLIFTF